MVVRVLRGRVGGVDLLRVCRKFSSRIKMTRRTMAKMGSRSFCRWRMRENGVQAGPYPLTDGEAGEGGGGCFGFDFLLDTAQQGSGGGGCGQATEHEGEQDRGRRGCGVVDKSCQGGKAENGNEDAGQDDLP